MKTTPMLFNGEMVRALLDGRKVQTRRIVKGVQNDNRMKVGGHIVTHVMDATKHDLCPYGQPGDLIWVRETWRKYDKFNECACYDHCCCPETGTPIYRASSYDDECIKWTPSIHMPRWASRLTLQITDIRVERVQDISEEDARAEGITDSMYDGPLPEAWESGPSHVDIFSDLWESTYPGSWERNDWVWVISFDVIRENVDRAITNLQEISG